MKLRLSDGAELFYTIDDYTDPWTQPETVVLHHGMAKNHQLWYAWIPILAQHYRVVRFDMRGMGQSSVPAPGYPWSLENFAKDLLELLDQLELSRVHLIGETVGVLIFVAESVGDLEAIELRDAAFGLLIERTKIGRVDLVLALNLFDHQLGVGDEFDSWMTVIKCPLQNSQEAGVLGKVVGFEAEELAEFG